MHGRSARTTATKVLADALTRAHAKQWHFAGKASIICSDTPASLGEQGPGEIITRCGFSVSASSTVMASLRKTCC